MIRWSWPISSAREYFEISQNLSLTYVMRPDTSVVATMADWSRAYLMSASSFTFGTIRVRRVRTRSQRTTTSDASTARTDRRIGMAGGPTDWVTAMSEQEPC